MKKYKVFEHRQYDSENVMEAQSVVEDNLITTIRNLPQKQVFPMLRSEKEYFEILVPNLTTETGGVIKPFIAQVHRNDIEKIYFQLD